MKKLIAAAASFALVGGLAVASPAVAGGTQNLTNAKFTWKLNSCAFGNSPSCGSLNSQQSVDGNVVKGSEGWEFSNGTGIRNVAAGTEKIDFTGSFTIGNSNRGNYSIKLANPSVSVDADNSAEVTADVSYRLDSTWTEGGRKVVTNLTDVPSTSSWTVTPDEVQSAIRPDLTEKPGFDQDFVQALSHNPDMRPWFQQSGSGSDSIKVAEPISVEFQEGEEVWTPQVTITGANGLAVTAKDKEITVSGKYFNPAHKVEDEVNGLYVAFGPDVQKIGSSTQDNAKYFLSVSTLFGNYPSDSGEFSTTLNIRGLYKAAGKSFDGRKQSLGVSVWAAHKDLVPAWRTFTKINFAKGVTAYTKPGKVRTLKRAKVTKSTASYKWGSSAATTADYKNNKAAYYLVRKTNNKANRSVRGGKRYSGWVKVSTKKRSATFKNVKKRGVYNFQFRAVNAKGAAGDVRTVTFKRR